MKLSILIPCYNAEKWVYSLFECLGRQLTKDVEVCVIDDGSAVKVEPPIWAKFKRHQKNKGTSKTRNELLKAASGEYFAFIDADDMISVNYVATILEKLKKDPDYIEMSWRTMDNTYQVKLNSAADSLPDTNPSTCMRVIKKAFIGNVRYNEKKDAAEDEQFYRDIDWASGKKDIISDFMYFYRQNIDGSNCSRFLKGLQNTKRSVWYYDHVTSDMTWLVDEIRKDREYNETILMTNRCDIPELAKVAHIMKPQPYPSHYIYGEKNNYLRQIPLPVKTQIIIFIRYTHIIGGIETFIYNFCRKMCEYYDIIFLYETMSPEQKNRLSAYVECKKYDPSESYICDSLLILRILDEIPKNITYKKSVRMCHACRTNPSWQILDDTDYIVNVSQASKDSFGDQAKDAVVIHNLVEKNNRDMLILLSATRIPAPDKGTNEKRMYKLAEMLDKAGIAYLWLNFSEGRLENAPKNFINMGVTFDIQTYMARADYVVQLSDSEAWSYTMLEALNLNKPLIVTPFPSAIEMGVVDGENGYIVPFSMDFDVKKLLNVPKFTYEYDNDSIVSSWRKIFGNTKPTHSYDPAAMVEVICKVSYQDMELNEILKIGDKRHMRKDRAEHISSLGYVEII